MTKTKRQLRAEAVERLSSWPVDAKAGPLLDTVLGKAYDPYDYEKNLVALIDLLTDDDPPEGDAVAILRKYANFWSASHATHTQCDSNWEFTTMQALADMVERDYVRQELYDESVEISEQIVNERERARAERDSLKRASERDADVMESLNVQLADMTAERDEWKAKAENQSATIDRMQDVIDGYVDQVTDLESDVDEWKAKALANDDSRAENGVRAESVDANDANTMQRESYRQYADLRERSETADCESDSRERLEAERDYWRTQFMRCLTVAIRQEEGPNLDKLMTYPKPDDVIEPFQLVTDEIHSLRDFHADDARRIRQLEGDLKGMRKSNYHWHRVAGKHSTEIQRLKRMLEAERELARMWPRYEDGRPVRVGDTVGRKVGSIEFFEDSVELRGVDHTCICRDLFGTQYDYPPLMAGDGEPIELGTMLYGGDGRAWVVESIDPTGKYQVEGSCDGEYKRLKAEWLTHEKPRTLEDVVYDIAINSVEVDRYSDGIPVLGVDRGQLRDEIEKHEAELREKLGGAE